MASPSLVSTQTVTFTTWKGRPQKPISVIDYATRIGAGSVHTQTTKTQSVITNAIAEKIYVNDTEAHFITAFNNDVTYLNDMLGKRVVWNDEQSRSISNVIPIQFTYTIKKKIGGIVGDDPTVSYIATYNIDVIVDGGV